MGRALIAAAGAALLLAADASAAISLMFNKLEAKVGERVVAYQPDRGILRVRG